MLDNLDIKNFKAHRKSYIEFGGLCILTGRNGMGKSSILQSLLLLRQSFLIEKDFKGLLLAGDLVNIGNSQDAFCDYSPENTMTFSLRTAEESFIWEFGRSNDKNYIPNELNENYTAIRDVNLFSHNFQYIAAEHLAAKESHARNTYYVEQLNQISEKFGDAKYTVHFLSHHSDKEIEVRELAHVNSKSLKLRDQVNAWLGEISPGVNTIIKENSEINSFNLRFIYELDDGLTREYKPENIGFGVSYILPLLVAVLSAPKNSLIVIENPESHLHPNGQAAVGRLLCKAAQFGIQILIETHSDHIVNAALVSIAEYSEDNKNGISNDRVRVYFIDREDGKAETSTVKMIIDDNGRIKKIPDHFFDQFSKDMKKMLGF